MYIHHEAGLIYLAHPRTASVATSTALRKVGFRKLEPPSDHHSRLWDDGTPVTPENRVNWTVFTTVRNHWDAAVSWVFQKYKARGGEPENWNLAAFRLALGPHNQWVQENRLWGLHASDADVIVRYEALEQQINDILVSAGVDPVSIPAHNVSRFREQRPYQMFYNDRTRQYIADRFEGEIAELGYTWESLSKNQARRETVINDQESCAGCGVLANRHPIVGVGRANRDESFKVYPICAACHQDPDHRNRDLKMHFFPRQEAASALDSAGSSVIGG